ncbi:MAG: DUF2232 domain-containing protein [Desulfobacteraceae bacterium]|jgi:uncharacterized protein YybS (DUF2232 family)|nr:MAG: DUF2232 domain-containing protein [Desulfobacteraceae bacterium]
MKLKELVGCLGWVSAFLACTMWLPFLGPLAGLLTPLPFFYYSARLGMAQGGVLTLLVILIVGVGGNLLGSGRIVILAAEYGVLGYTLSMLLSKDLSLAKTIAMATGVLAVVGGCTLLLMAGMKGLGVGEMLKAYLSEEFKATIGAYREMGILDATGEDLDAAVQAFVEIFSRLLPSLMLVGTGLVVWMNTVLARALIRIARLPSGQTEPVSLWQAPEQLVWIVIAAGFGSFLAGGPLQWIALNLLIVLGTVYFFQGLCITIFFLDKYKVPTWARVGLYILIAVQQLFLVVLALGGLFDQWIDFRKIHRKAGR